MSKWRFEEEQRCHLFTQWVAYGQPGSTNVFSGSPNLEATEELGIVRANAVSALLEGTLHVEYRERDSYEAEGFTVKNGHTNLKQCGPQGWCESTAVTDIVWWCCFPRDGSRLDYTILEDGATLLPENETFIIPVEVGVTVNGEPVDKFEVVRAAGPQQRLIEGGKAFAIWRR